MSTVTVVTIKKRKNNGNKEKTGLSTPEDDQLDVRRLDGYACAECLQ